MEERSPFGSCAFCFGGCRVWSQMDRASVAVGDEIVFGEDELVGRLVLLALGVLAEDVDFDIERAAGSERVQAGGGVGVGDDGYFDVVVGDGGYGEADAFNGDGALGDDVAGEVVGELEAEAPVGLGGVGREGGQGDEGGGAVDVALNDVAAEGRTGGGWEFEVEDGVGAEVGEGGAGDGLGGEVGGEARGEGVGLDAEGGEADAVDRDAVAGVEAGGERGGGDGDAGGSCGGGDGEQGAGGFDQAGEHGFSLSDFCEDGA
jgi:hypothetical protein